jgi:hypothetical protein
VQTGITSMSPSASLDVAHLFSLQSGAVFMAVSYELPEQCEHVVTFPLVCIHLTLTPLPKWDMTSFSMGARSPFLACFCDTKPKVHIAKI